MLAASGLLMQFGLQALINMGSTVQLMPTKGMTLPFISYGGSSALATRLAIGMLLALTRRRVQHRRDRHERARSLRRSHRARHRRHRRPCVPGRGAGRRAARGAAHDLALITDARGKRWKGALAQHPIHYIRAASPSGGVMGKLIGCAAAWALGFFDARTALRGLHPSAVVGFGGYASVPTLLAASRARRADRDPRAERRAGPRQPLLVGRRARASPPRFPRVRFLADDARAPC